MRPCVFIHTNHRQNVGAIVSRYSLKRNSACPDNFDVRIIDACDQQFMRDREGQLYLRDGDKRAWLNDDLQSFTPLRFMPPQLMGYQGRALVIDPDVFAVGDVWDLLSRDMNSKALMCRPKSGSKGRRGALASSVMLMDCTRLRHWEVEKQFGEMFDFSRDYMDWISLKLEDRDTIGLFESQWNDFDHLDVDTKMLHNTKRKTQPWKTGLTVDYRPADTFRLFPPRHWIRRHAARLRDHATDRSGAKRSAQKTPAHEVERDECEAQARQPTKWSIHNHPQAPCGSTLAWGRLTRWGDTTHAYR